MDKINRVISDTNIFLSHHLINLKRMLANRLENGQSAINYLLDRTGTGDLVFMEVGLELNRKVFLVGIVIQDTFNDCEDGHSLVLEYEFQGEDDEEGWNQVELIAVALEGLLFSRGIMIQDREDVDTESILNHINCQGVRVMIENYDQN